MRKSITWLKLYQRIGKQLLKDTRGKKVELHMNGVRYEVALVFTHNGSKWHLEPTKVIEEGAENDRHKS